MTREEAIEYLNTIGQYYSQDHSDPYEDCEKLTKDELDALYMAIKALEQEPCGDAISRQIISDYVQSHIQEINTGYGDLNKHTNEILRMIVDYIESMPPVNPQPKLCDDAIDRVEAIKIASGYCHPANIPKELAKLPPVNPQEPKTGHCKDCKYFEYDSVAKVDGIPLIVAHEICSRWGDGCKTREDGYCFLFEPQESEVEE